MKLRVFDCVLFTLITTLILADVFALGVVWQMKRDEPVLMEAKQETEFYIKELRSKNVHHPSPISGVSP